MRHFLLPWLMVFWKMSLQAWMMRLWRFGLANKKVIHSTMVCLWSSMPGSLEPSITASAVVRHLPGTLPATAWRAERRCSVMTLGERPMIWWP